MFGCAGGFSCGSCSDAYAFPQTSAAVPAGTEFVEGGMRMRLTQGALDFLRNNLRTLLTSQLGSDPAYPGYIVVAVPGTTTIVSGSAGSLALGGFGGESYPTKLLIDANAFEQNLQINFDDGANAVRIRADNIPVGIDARVYGEADVLFTEATAACNITGTAGGASGVGIITDISIDMLVTPDVGRGAQCDLGVGECILIDVNVTSVALGDIGAGSLEIAAATNCSTSPGRQCSAECSDTFPIVDDDGDTECQVLCGVTDFLADLALGIVGFIEPFIEPFLDNLLNNAIRNALDELNGSPLSFSSRLATSTLGGGALSSTALDLGYAVAPTGNAFDVNNPAGNAAALGMDLILKSGFEAAPPLDAAADALIPHPCVRPIAGAAFQELYGDGQFRADNLPALSGVFDGSVYHIGASLAAPAINQILFALYNSGALCLELTSESIANLTGGGFDLSADTLDLLTGNRLSQFAAPGAPAIVVLSPSQPPVVEYGAGTLDDGHIKVDWPGVEVSFYVEMYERPSRVFAVKTDIALQLAVFNDPANETLRISVVQGPTADNFEPTYNELMPGVDFSEILESLIGAALDGVVGDSLEFSYDVGPALSNVLGGAPVFVDFMGLETTPAGNPEALSIYIRLLDQQPSPQLVGTRGLRLPANIDVVRLPEAQLAHTALPTGHVNINLDVPDDNRAREYFARVDFGMWRGPLHASGDLLVVEDAKLRLSGHHVVTVRARVQGEPNTLESETLAQQVEFWVDGKAPSVRLERDDGVLRAVGTDDHAPADELQYLWQLDEQDERAAGPLFDLNATDARVVRVRACDPAGNCSKQAAVTVEIERKRMVDDVAQAELARGCGQSGPAPLWAMGLLSAWALRRRRGPRA
jgi:hypothetical protein